MRAVSGLMLAVALGACGGINYQYDGRTFRSSEQALAAARASNEAMVARIPAAPRRIGGTLHFYVPDRQTILDRSIRRTGAPNQRIVDYVADSTVIGWRGFYDALVKRGAFDRVLFHQSQGEHVAGRPGEYVLYVYRPNVDTEIFFLESDQARREVVPYDGSGDRTQKVLRWLENIEAAARRR